MSITYPEAKPSIAPRKVGGANVMNAGSALFPSGAASLYERASKARKSKNTRLAWFAAPVAVILIGGGAYLALSHGAAPKATATSTIRTTTTAPASPILTAVAPAPDVQQAGPKVVTTHEAQVHTVVRTTTPAMRSGPVHHEVRSTTVTASVSAPTTSPVTAAPEPAAPVTPMVNTAPTAGNFVFTPAAPAPAASVSPTQDVQPAPQPATPPQA